MSLDYSVLINIIMWASAFALVLFILYKRYLYSVFDPLFTYLYTTAFSSVLVINVVQENRYIVSYFICHIFLFLGFFTIQKLNNSKTEKIHYSFYDLNLLRVTAYILMFIYVLSNIFTFITRGAALFSDDPYARETNFENGFGIFRRVNWGIGSFLVAALTILYVKERKSKYIYMMLSLALFTVMEGTKSSLLRILIVMAAMLEHPYFKEKYSISSSIKKYTPIGVILLFAAFFFVLIKESSGNSDVFLSFVNRLLSGADSVIYFYIPQNEYLLRSYHPWDYPMYILNPILGFLHLVPYVEPFGAVTVANSRVSGSASEIYLAPNTPFYLEGQIFFGYYGAFIFSFVLGGIIAFIRKIFFSLIKGSYFSLALLCTIFFQSTPIVNETSLFVKSCLDTFIFVLPTYVFVALYYRSKVVFKKLGFNLQVR